MLRSVAIGALALAAPAGALAAPAGAAVVVDQTGAPTVLSARDGRFVWSQQRGSRWRLVTLAGGAVLPVAVAPRAGGPFDVDLGADARGRPVATYTRRGRPFEFRFAARTGAAGVERRLDVRGLHGAGLRWPVRDGGRIAAVARFRDSDIVVTGMAGGRLLSLAGGPRSRGRATHLDAAGGRIVLRWRDGRGTAVVLLTPGPPGVHAARRVLARAAAGSGRVLSSPGFDAGQAVWAEHRETRPGSAGRPCDCVHAFGLAARAWLAPFESDTYAEITGVARTAGRVLAADALGTVADVTPRG